MTVHWIAATRLSKKDKKVIQQWKAGHAQNEPVVREARDARDVHDARDPLLRTFFLVDADGHKLLLQGGHKPPKFVTKAPVEDVAKKAMHFMLRHNQQPNVMQQTQAPVAVVNAVQRAVADNFMCNCPKSSGCTNRLRCNEASAAHGKQYLQKYATDAAKLNAEVVTIHLAEQGKPGVGEYRGGYRLIAEPTSDLIRNGYTTSVDAKYVRTLHLTHVPQ